MNSHRIGGCILRRSAGSLLLGLEAKHQREISDLRRVEAEALDLHRHSSLLVGGQKIVVQGCQPGVLRQMRDPTEAVDITRRQLHHQRVAKVQRNICPIVGGTQRHRLCPQRCRTSQQPRKPEHDCNSSEDHCSSYFPEIQSVKPGPHFAFATLPSPWTATAHPVQSRSNPRAETDTATPRRLQGECAMPARPDKVLEPPETTSALQSTRAAETLPVR